MQAAPEAGRVSIALDVAVLITASTVIKTILLYVFS
jgi:hypothetical protein